MIIHFRKHRSYWRTFRQASPAFYGLPHTCDPRGRAVYVNAPARYHLELGPELVADGDMVRQAMEAMHLPAGCCAKHGRAGSPERPCIRASSRTISRG